MAGIIPPGGGKVKPRLIRLKGMGTTDGAETPRTLPAHYLAGGVAAEALVAANFAASQMARW